MVFLCRKETGQSFIHTHFYTVLFSLIQSSQIPAPFCPLEEQTSQPICLSRTCSSNPWSKASVHLLSAALNGAAEPAACRCTNRALMAQAEPLAPPASTGRRRKCKAQLLSVRKMHGNSSNPSDLNGPGPKPRLRRRKF